jgi:AcrR family transcriptional regulator
VGPARTRLSAETWATAALEAIGEGGLAAVAVEPLAARLGATKGSFYWHFANRDALIEAALVLWEERFTAATIAGLAGEADPRARLRKLFASVIGRASRVELNLLAAADHPLVSPFVERVVRRRLAYVVEQFAEIGFDVREAAHRGVLAYTAYVGHLQLAVRMPEVLAATPDGYVDSVIGVLLAGVE